MQTAEAARSWAEQVFGGAELGHASRTSCLVRVAGWMMAKPATVVTRFCDTSASRQCAYGWLENDSVEAEAVTEAAAAHALKTVAGEEGPLVVAVDGSSVRLTDRAGDKGFGRVGPRGEAKGLQTQTALLVDARGAPLEVLAQRYWARPEKQAKRTKSKTDRRPPEAKETQQWLDVLSACEDQAAAHGVEARLWFQLDRGYDCWPILTHMASSKARYTVRGAYNRALWSDGPKPSAHDRYVQDALARSDVVGTYALEVPARPGRAERTAKLEVRMAAITLRLHDPSQQVHARPWPETLWAVEVKEDPAALADDTEALRWMLWTNRPLHTLDDAKEVVRRYGHRWRVEEFHRMWKSGALRVEDSQVRHATHFERIARLAAAVACRLLRLSYLARTCPSEPAESALEPIECEALRTLVGPGQDISSLSSAVLAIANLGGYTGKSSGGPPGPVVLARGFRELRQACRLLLRLKQIRDQ